jgi:hypothetical protein
MPHRALDSPGDLVPAEAQIQQLSPGDDTMLYLGKPCDRSIHSTGLPGDRPIRACPAFCRLTRLNAGFTGHSTEDGVRPRAGCAPVVKFQAGK